MIVKNEQDVLARCLESVQGLFDEIIIVDTGSTDKTKEIASSYTDKIYDFEWIDDFSAARNYAFSKATCDYVMWLDADDVVTPENLEKLKEVKQKLDGSVDCYMVKYAIAFNEYNQPTFVYYRERILKNDGTFFWIDPVHEVITPHGKIEHLDIYISHLKIKPTPAGRNLKIYEKLKSQGKPFTPRQTFYYARELYYNGLYNESIEVFKDFINNQNGWIENKIEACLMLAKCYIALKDYHNALSNLFYSFTFDTPRAEILCEIASIYAVLKDYKKVLYWAKLAKKVKINVSSGAFVVPECYDVLPNLQICVAYYHLNKINLSKKYNDLVLKIQPNNISANINKQLFEQLKKQRISKASK